MAGINVKSPKVHVRPAKTAMGRRPNIAQAKIGPFSGKGPKSSPKATNKKMPVSGY